MPRLDNHYFGLPAGYRVPSWFHDIVFINGLPGLGKSKCLSGVYRKDHGNALCLNFMRYQRIDSLNYSVDYIRVRNRNKAQEPKAYQIPKFEQYARFQFLRLYKLKHPHIKHILVDEIEYYPLKRTIDLMYELHRLYPGVPIILSGVLISLKNKPYRTGLYLLKNCRSVNLNPKCKFCGRRAVYLLNVYDHQQITYQEIDAIKDRKLRNYVKHHLKDYYVCYKHLFTQPKGALRNL